MALDELIMPKIGMYDEDICLAEWLKDEGAQVRSGEPLFTFETDKITSEVEAERAGWLHRVVAAGALVPIGGTVGIIASTPEEYEALLARSSPPSAEAAPAYAAPPKRVAPPTKLAAPPLVATPRPKQPPAEFVPDATWAVKLDLYRTMATIRAFEQRLAREFRTGEVPGFVHLSIGQESVAATVCAHLTDVDVVTSTHRGHGHAIAKGCDLDRMMAEIYGRETGLCHGRGGSMHVADFTCGMAGANAIVGGGIALATGAALSAQVLDTADVAVAFFGDGAANQGVLHESLNLAAIWKLPIVFVCENNGFAESTPASYSTSVERIATRAAGYGIPGVTVDSYDVLSLWRAAGEAVAHARLNRGPTLLEALTYRARGHFEGDPEVYRHDEERAATRERDAVAHLRALLGEDGPASEAELATLDAEIATAIDHAVEFARTSPWPDPADVLRDVYADPVP